MATDSTRLENKILRRWILPLACCGWLLAAAFPCAAQDTVAVDAQPIDLVMFHDPPLETGKFKLTFAPGLKALWLKALARPDSELKRLAADSFALAHQRGLTDLEDTHSHLAALLKAPAQDLGVQRAAVHALIQLDAREYAGLLAETARSLGLTTSLLVEPALARWNSDVMKDAWLARIDDPLASRAARILAIDGLGQTRELQAGASLKRIAGDSHLAANERMAAARALSAMQAPGLVEMAGTLVGTNSKPALLNPILAIELLQREDSPQAVELLGELAVHASTAVQTGALRRLYAIEPRHVYRFAEAATGSPDAGVRTVGARALIEQKESRWIPRLATLLDDVNPTIRKDVAQALVQLAGEPALRADVIKHATEVLLQDRWRGIEQAAVVLVLLDHKPAGNRLVELLPHPRAEVKIVSAWGLRRLALPEHLPAMLAKAQSNYDEFLAGIFPFNIPGSELQSMQLFMAFGQMRYADAEPLLTRYVPKEHLLGTFARAAAVWSLGLLHEGKATPDLSAALLARLGDHLSLDPESGEVRRMSAISLGRMKSVSAVPGIRRIIASDGGYPKRASYWALEQLTGEAPPPPEQFQVVFADWFLAPAN